jgi:hypothetical protein
MAGPNHPFYLTSSIVGGGSFSGFANETVYGGGEEVAGNIAGSGCQVSTAWVGACGDGSLLEHSIGC